MMSPKNDYIFVRHGETFWNKKKIMHGQHEIPLTYKGMQQAKDVAEALRQERFDVCFCSPLSRAKATAAQIMRHHRACPVFFDDRLIELSKGKLEGAHVSSENLLKTEDKEILSKFEIESKKDFFYRVCQFVKEVESIYSGKKILIVAHSGTIKMLMFVFDYPKKPIHIAYYEYSIKNCRPYRLGLCAKPYKEVKTMKVGLFPMVADILHSGHVIALEEAKKQCDYLVVALHCSPSYKQPVQSIYERFMQLRAVKWVDEVIPYENSERDSDLFISFDYDVYFLGQDHQSGDWELRSSIERLGKQVVYLSRAHGYSSTRLKSEICK